MVEFGKKVLMVGFGSVAQCTLPILVKHLRVPLANITVMDFEDQTHLLKEWTAQGVRFVRDKITPENMGSTLAKYLGPGDLLIDFPFQIIQIARRLAVIFGDDFVTTAVITDGTAERQMDI